MRRSGGATTTGKRGGEGRLQGGGGGGGVKPTDAEGARREVLSDDGALGDLRGVNGRKRLLALDGLAIAAHSQGLGSLEGGSDVLDAACVLVDALEGGNDRQVHCGRGGREGRKGGEGARLSSHLVPEGGAASLQGSRVPGSLTPARAGPLDELEKVLVRREVRVAEVELNL